MQQNNPLKVIIRKNDLKYLKKVDTKNNYLESDVYESSTINRTRNMTVEFDSEVTENLYNEYVNKNKVELRIKLTEDENYDFFDLSSLKITDDLLNKLFKMPEIKNILKKTKFLDISNNKLTNIPDLSKYLNIKVLDVSFNNIEGDFINNNLEEFVCKNNKITSIISNSLLRIDASNNKLNKIDVKNIQYLGVSNNNLTEIESYKDLDYLDCSCNKIEEIQNLFKLTELYCSQNLITIISGIDSLIILNCVDNPLNKINYFPNLTTIVSSTAKISSNYKIISAKKVDDDYFITVESSSHDNNINNKYILN